MSSVELVGGASSDKGEHSREGNRDPSTAPEEPIAAESSKKRAG
jgi:hypothetical protein